ncbi:MAG: zinc metalloprotease, partial [Bacteroidota bacterium]|nr:zinc metalloprotease [Bacteroidota bacterium]
MRKISVAVLGAVLLIISCQKNDRPVVESVDDQPATQSGRKCAAQEVLEEQIKADPERGKYLEELERKTEQFKGRDQTMSRAAGKLYVPVVINVVLPNADQVTDAQIQSQLNALNMDYGHANTELTPGVYLAGYPYSNVANCAIEFYIENASTDIRRKNNTTTPTFGSNDAVKKTAQGGLDPLSATTKLNFWVCDLGSGLLGYA